MLYVDEPRVREREALEKCDLILEALQQYLRGDCRVKDIRRAIKDRLESLESR